MQKRSCFVINFDSGPKNTLQTFNFPKKEPYDISKIIDMCEFFSGGGTDFEPPLDLSKDMIESDGNFDKGDILFITDGEAPVRQNWLVDFLIWKKSKKVSIYSILIDAYSNTTDTLIKFSNDIIKLRDLKNSAKFDEAAVSIFTTL